MCNSVLLVSRFIEYCEGVGACVGVARDREEEELEDLVQRLQAIELIDGTLCTDTDCNDQNLLLALYVNN